MELKWNSKFIIFVILFASISAVISAASFGAQGQVAPKPDIYLFWSADTYVPSDYPGKALPVYDSWVTVTAVVSGGINPDDLFFHWWVDDFYQTQDVGAGRKSYRRHIDIVSSGTTYSVKVLAVSRDNKTRLERVIDITTASPEIAVYRYDGAKKRQMSGANEEENVKFGEQVDFLAVPLFFSAQKISDLIFKWQPEGGGEIESKKETANFLSLKIPDSPDLTELMSGIALSIENPFSDVQKKSTNIVLNITR